MATATMEAGAARGSSGRIPTARLIAFASTGIPQASLLLVAGTYLPQLYTVHIGLSLIAYTMATTTVRIVDLLFDPFLGWMMDRTKFAFGRFRPWFVAGVPVTMAGGYMLLNPPANADMVYLGLWYLVMWIGVSMLALSHAAWAASLSVNYHERSRIYGWMIALAPVGSVGLLLLPFITGGHLNLTGYGIPIDWNWHLTAKPLVVGKADSYHPISLMIMLILPLSTFFMASFTPERPPADVQGAKFGFGDYWDMIKRPTMAKLIIADLMFTLGPGVTGPLYNFFFHQIKQFKQEDVNYLLIGYTGGALLGGILWSQLAQKIGKHRAIQVAAVSYMICQSSLMAIPAGWFLESFLGMIAAGFSASAFLLLIRAMVADYADQIRLEQGKERAGVLYALVTTTQKLGQSINVLLVFPVLQLLFHFNPRSEVNDDFAKLGLQLCYLFAPVIFVGIAAMFFFNYKLDKTAHDEIRIKLEERDAQMRGAAGGDLTTGPIDAD